MSRVVVVGGGISGLTAAWRLAGLGHDVLVLEGSSEIGGKLRHGVVAGVGIDLGAESMLWRRPEAVELVAELGLVEDVVHPVTASASLRVGGAIHPLPAKTMLGIPSDLEAVRSSGALTDAGVARVAAEPDQPPLDPIVDDVTVGALVRSRFGNEVAERLVEPLLGGVYAGRADQLSLQATMPALAQALRSGGALMHAAAEVVDRGAHAGTGPVFASLRGGMAALPVALARTSAFTTRTSATVRSVDRTPNGFALTVGSTAEPELIQADAVVVAVPPGKAARLLRSLAPAASIELDRVESASMALVSFAFPALTLPPGSGLLVGTGEALTVKAVTVSSQKWKLETGGLTMLRASLGRVGEETVLQRPDEELVSIALSDLGRIFGLDTPPVDAVVTRWGGGLPQYALGHVDAMRRVREAVASVPGLAIAGAVLDGVGIPACIASATAAAHAVHTSLNARFSGGGQ